MSSTTTAPAPPGAAAPEPFIRDRRWAFDFALTAAVAVVSVAPYVAGGEDRLAFTSFALCAALLVRRQFPRIAVGWAIAAALLQVWLVAQPTLSIVVVPMIVYAAARWSARSTAVVALLASLAGALLGPWRWSISVAGGVVATLVATVGCAAVVALVYLFGRRLQDHHLTMQERAQAAMEQQRLRQAEAQQRARVAAVDERSRIARELHDIVAHSLSVIIVQAEGGRAVALKKPETAAEVLDTIAVTGRDALGEMRRIVDLLRGGAGDGYAPSPGLGDIAELVERGGEQFALTVYGSPPVTSPTLGLTAYRIIQESMTNVLKHAGPGARARITLAYTPQTVEIEINDDGRGAAVSPPGSAGHGLQGMVERVAVLGGTLATGPRPGGGFGVRATLPLGSGA